MSGQQVNAAANKKRPKFLNLTAIRLPLPGFVSILHRISGAVLFLSLPWLILLFDLSLSSPEGFARAAELMHMPMIAIPLFGLLWAFIHHFCAGVRFLLLDLQIGLEKRAAFRSSLAVMVVSLLLTLLLLARFVRVL